MFCTPPLSLRPNFRRTRLFLEAVEDNVLFARFPPARYLDLASRSTQSAGAYLRLAVLWAKAGSISDRLLDGWEAEKRAVEALKDGENSPTFLPRGDVVVSTPPRKLHVAWLVSNSDWGICPVFISTVPIDCKEYSKLTMHGVIPGGEIKKERYPFPS